MITPSLSKEAKRELLCIARETLTRYLNKREFHDVEPQEKSLLAPSGAFVTLESQGELRGCIGLLYPEKPLYLTVQEMVIQAATGDPRFHSVSLEELAKIQVEISVLSTFQEVKDISEIKVGRDGLIISKGMHRGLLLPQVAAREGWNIDTFLSYTCLKAGLPADSWKRAGVKIETFTADVFSEVDFG